MLIDSGASDCSPVIKRGVPRIPLNLTWSTRVFSDYVVPIRSPRDRCPGSADKTFGSSDRKIPGERFWSEAEVNDLKLENCFECPILSIS
jgi:hypothetical protein